MAAVRRDEIAPVGQHIVTRCQSLAGPGALSVDVGIMEDVVTSAAAGKGGRRPRQWTKFAEQLAARSTAAMARVCVYDEFARVFACRDPDVGVRPLAPPCL